MGQAVLNTGAFRAEPDRTDAEKLQDADLEEIRRIVQDPDWRKTFDAEIAERPSWSKLFHLSDIRKNVLRPFARWFYQTMAGHGRVLELGAGCGAATGLLAADAAHVDAVDASEKRCQINAIRHPDMEQLTIFAGAYAQVEPQLGKYDLIVVQESASCRMTAELLREIMTRHMSPGGELWILAENRLGFQYLAGTPEQLSGKFFRGLEQEKKERTPKNRSREEWLQLLREAGIAPQTAQWYYPYPDCRFTMALYSDDRLPVPGELNSIDNNFDRKRLRLFDDRKVQETFLENGLFPAFSNSYLLRIPADGVADAAERKKALPAYVKFSNERAASFAFYTEITAGRRVEKVAVSREGTEHLQHIHRMQKKLEEMYGADLQVNRSDWKGDSLELAYVSGETFASHVEDVLRSAGEEAALGEIREYLALVIPERGRIPFREDDGRFARVFGQKAGPAFQPGTESLPASDIDLIMENLIRRDENNILLDYEWTFDFPIPVDFLKYRVLHYFAETCAESPWSTGELCSLLGVDAGLIPVFSGMEQNFQRYAAGDHVAVRDLYEKISPGIWPVQALLEQTGEREKRAGLRLYYSSDGTFSEERSEVFPVRERKAKLRKYLAPEITQVRMDPGEESCVCLIRKLAVNGAEIMRPESNGKKGRGGIYVFSHPDPWVLLKGLAPGSLLEIEIEINPMDTDIMKSLGGLFRPETPREGEHTSFRERAENIWRRRKG